jgi:hypothetical protein
MTLATLVHWKHHARMTQGVADKASYISSFHAAVATCLSDTASAQVPQEEEDARAGHGEEESRERAPTSNLCEVLQVEALARLAVATAEVCSQGSLLA